MKNTMKIVTNCVSTFTGKAKIMIKDGYKLAIYNLIFIVFSTILLGFILISDYSEHVRGDEIVTTKEFEGIELEYLCKVNHCVNIEYGGAVYELDEEGFLDALDIHHNHNILIDINDNTKILYDMNILIVFSKGYDIIIPGNEIVKNIKSFMTWVVLILIFFNFYVVIVEFRKIRLDKFKSIISVESQMHNNSLMILTENLNHELNTPITVLNAKFNKFIKIMNDYHETLENVVINEYTEGLVDLCSTKNAAFKKDFKIIKGSLIQIGDILDKMKKFKFLRGNSARNLFEVLQTTLDIFLVTQSEKFEYEISQEFAEYKLDPILGEGELTGILINFVKNSIEHGNATFIEIDFIRCEKDSLTMRIIDDGNGMPDEVANHIFDENFSTKSTSENTGNGLYINKFLLEQNGGGARLYDTSTNGTKFDITVKTSKFYKMEIDLN